MKKFLLSIFCLFSLVSFATADNYSHTFQKGDINANGAVTLSGVEWTLDGDGSYWGWDSNSSKGIQLGSSKLPYKSMTLSTNGISGTISKISINTSGASDIKGSFTITVGGAEIGNATLTKTATDYSFDCNASGDIVISYTQTSSKAIYIKSIAIEYTAAAASSVATPTFSVEAGKHYNPFSVEIAAEEGATVYYTLDGTEPTAESTVYSEAIAFNEFGTSATIKAIAVANGESSNVASATYSLEVAAPVFSVKGGVYTKLSGETALKFTCETEGATIYYNNRGGDPKTEGSKSYGSLSVLSTAEVKAVAFIEVDGEKLYSDVVSEKYYISPVKPYEKATEFVAGEYIIYSKGYLAQTLSETKSYDYLPQFAVEANGNFIETNAFYAFTFTEVEGGYTIQDTFGRYVYQKDDHNSFNVAAEMPEAGAVWTVVIDETTGEATITNVEKNKYIQYSAQYKSYGSYATAQSNAFKPSLYKLGEYPTMTVTPENWETIPAFEKVTITCESGIKYNETDENYPYYTIGWDNSPKDFDEAIIIDENTIELTFNTPIADNGDYRVVLPEGLFILDPDGLAMPSAKTQCTYTVENPNVLEIIYANPDNGDQVKSIEYLYFEYSQNIFDQVDGAVITNEKGEEFPLTVTYTDSWGDNTPYNALCLKTAEPITAAGTYTFVLKKEYACTDAGVRLTEDITYTFTLVEGLKITGSTPADGAEVESIEEIILEFNQDIICYAEAFMLANENGEEYYLLPAETAKDGSELPFNVVRMVAETPITAAGTYTLYINEWTIVNSNWETLSEQTLTFTIPGAAEPLAVIAQTPAADEEVESFSAITFEFNKDIEFIQAAGGTGTDATGGTNGTDATGGTNGTDATGGTNGTSGPAQYIKLKDANGGVTATYWVNAATIDGATVTFVPEMNATISNPGTYTFEIPAGLIKATDGEEYAGGTFTFTVVEPTGIEDVDAEVENNVIYDLSGRKIETITKGGIYIIGGKKVYVK